MSSSMAVTSAMDAPMSSSFGAMGPLFRKLDSLLPPGYRLPKLLKDRIQLLKADLEEISVALLEQSMVDSPNEMAKYWMNEVRELCYDIEDFIDNMMSTHADAKMSSVQSYKVGRVKIAWLPKTLKPCTRAGKVAELSTLVREASERHDRYLDGCTSSSSRRVFTGHGRIPALFADTSSSANNLVGVDDSKAKLIKWLTDEEQQLKVVALAGPAGEEAFPSLQRLELSFNAHRGEQYDHLLSGIDHLLNVKEIAGTIGAAAGAEEPDRRVAESAFKDAVRKHPGFPSYDNVKRVDWVCEEYQITIQEKDSSSENQEILQKEPKRKEGDLSDDQSRIALKEIEEDTKLYADKISHFRPTSSIIPLNQMKTGNQVAHVYCGKCRTLLMYQYGASLSFIATLPEMCFCPFQASPGTDQKPSS
ncbi:hypothetical protein ACQ4PT_056855 [Festuca glaucescens]